MTKIYVKCLWFRSLVLLILVGVFLRTGWVCSVLLGISAGYNWHQSASYSTTLGLRCKLYAYPKPKILHPKPYIPNPPLMQEELAKGFGGTHILTPNRANMGAYMITNLGFRVLQGPK